jgi:hypothetical protein
MNSPAPEIPNSTVLLQMAPHCCSLTKGPKTLPLTKPAQSGNLLELPEKGWSIQIAHTFQDIADCWNTPPNPFLQSAFLRVLEVYPPRGMSFAYVVFFYEQKPAGIAYGQLIDLKIRESLAASLSTSKSVWGQMKQQLAGLARYQLLVCGNMLLTGANGFHFSSTKLSGDLVARLLEAAFREVSESFRQNGRIVNLFMVKDINPCCPEVSKTLFLSGFHEFTFQPDMNLAIDRTWTNLDDYFQAMSSKYRVRARRAIKKGQGLSKRTLNLAVAEIECASLHHLYREVASNADFNPYELHPEYFVALKRALPEQFRIFGYYLKDELVGFFTTIRLEEKMEAHLLGFKNSVNTSHQLYLNMLYDMVGFAIEEGVSKLGFARTAMEIKSSVGAEPQHLDCRIRHASPIANTLMPYFIRWFEPNADWIQRHPFRKES